MVWREGGLGVLLEMTGVGEEPEGVREDTQGLAFSCCSVCPVRKQQEVSVADQVSHFRSAGSSVFRTVTHQDNYWLSRPI